MRKSMQIVAVMLVIIMSMCSFAFAGEVPAVDVNADTGAVVINGTTTPNADVNVVIEKNNKRYYLDTTKADENGKYSFSSKLPKAMEFKCNIDGKNLDVSTVNSSEPDEDDPSDEPDEDNPVEPNQKLEVKFSIDKKNIDKGYVLKPIKVEFEKGDTVWDVTKEILDEEDIDYEYSSNNQYDSVYVESIDGDGEFDHGPDSGWMYNVNGKYPGYGCSKYKLKDGDNIEWRYTTKLGADLGDAASGAIPSDKKVLEEDNNSAKIEVEAKTNSKGKAEANLTDKDISNAIKEAIQKVEKAGKNKKTEVKIEVDADSKAKEVEIKIPNDSMKKLQKKVDVVTVKTPIANISFDKDSLKNTYEGKGDVKLTVAKVDTSKLSEDNKKLVGDKPVFDLNIDVGGKSVKNFEGKVKVSLPYKPKKDENTSNLTVYYIADKGKATEMEDASYDNKSKMIVFTTNHFSTFAVVYDESKIIFNDVKSDNWFYTAVQFVVGEGLFKGTHEQKFEPNDNMTRAMLVTVLYRMEKAPTVTSSSTFEDVQKDTWYSDPVAWAAENKIVNGYKNGLFGTNDRITREQIATILYRYAKTKGYDITTKAELTAYTDKDKVSSWAIDPMKWAVSSKIISGRTATTLSVEGTATRAEVATMLMRFMKDISK